MKWMTHQAGALLWGACLGAPPAALLMALPGAILPDLADLKLARASGGKGKTRKAFNKLHRGSSHWFGWWLGLFLLALAAPLPAIAQDAAAGLALGGFSHVLMDMMTPKGVPLLPFSRKRRASTPICSTGGKGEWLFFAIILAAGAALAAFKARALFS